ncbi:MAG TPA: MerR family transcriptional regulator [Hyphomonadaceae bacterium]|nr:MerR family transcriptional regulator [Hyphomonadaceae bacterium]HPI49884.1 MerR family transcriptional regulator [Hyphomonadaceae bacterium]
MSTTSQAVLSPESDSESGYACDKSAEAFRTIGEAAGELGLKTHVLRFWETKFDNLRPMKRPDGRRFYRPDDMELLRRLQNLLHVQGLTVRGAIKALDGDIGDQPGAAAEVEAEGAEEMMIPVETGASVRELQEAVRDAVERGDFRAPEVQTSSAAKQRLESLLSDLTSLKSRLDAVRTAA